jgi:pimeloyl-ACP methyl ester carboxylesterase
MPDERTVSGDGVSLHTREWPAGDRSALLVHGLASTSRVWDFVAPRLAEAGLHTVAYDQRGHGRSAKPRSGYGFDHTIADAADVARTLRLKRPVAVGHSWGANVVLELAVRRPRLVGAAVLIDGGFLNLRDRFDWPEAKQALAPPPIAGTPVHAFLHGIGRHLGRAMEVTPEVEAVLLSLVRIDHDARIHPRLSRANHLQILRALWEQDTLELLGRVRVPTLVLAVRSPDASGPPGFREQKQRSARLVRAIGDPVRFEWIDGIHDVPLQRPDAVARRILRIVSGLVG